MFQSKKLFHILSDFLVLNLALTIIYYWFFKDLNYYAIQEFKVATPIVNLLWFSTFSYPNRVYRPFEYTTFMHEIRNFFPDYVVYISLFTLPFVFFFQKEGLIISLCFGALLFSFCLIRISIKFSISKTLRYTTVNYVTIGYCYTLIKIEKTISEAHMGKVNYLGSFGQSSEQHHKHLGSVAEIDEFLKINDVNLILYVSNSLPPSVLRRLMHYAKHNFIEFKIIPLEMDIITHGAKLELHEGFFLSAKDEYVSYSIDGFLKRLFDVVFSSVVIVCILTWLFPLICLIILLESKGSPIFLQERVGFHGRIFRCIKFRSMSVAENGVEVKQVKYNDKRITKTGAFIRKTNLDEMPQFFNVFIGDMSVVGPRPHAVSHDIEFKNTTEEYILRHYTKPGITGWAQVNGWRGPTDTYSKIIKRTQCDLWYVRNWSLLLDIKIIFLTVFSTKVRQNAF